MTSELVIVMVFCLLGVGCITSFCLGRYYESRIWEVNDDE